MQDNRAFKGIWIPKEIWLNKDLSLIEKVFLVEIDSLDNDKGCFASNAYFANFFGMSKGRCSQIIKSLESKKLISIRIEREGKQIVKRVVKILNRGIKYSKQPSEFTKHPYLENDEENNTSINNTDSKVDSLEVCTNLDAKELIKKIGKGQYDLFDEVKLNGKRVMLLIDFLEYRKEVKKVYKSKKAIKSLIKRFDIEPIEKIEWVINSTIENQWQGLFWGKYQEQTIIGHAAPKDDYHLSQEMEELYQRYLGWVQKEFPVIWKRKFYLSKEKYEDLKTDRTITKRRFIVDDKQYKRLFEKKHKEANEAIYKLEKAGDMLKFIQLAVRKISVQGE